VSDEVTDTLVKGGYLAHGCTYSGHPASCAAALASIEIIEKEKLVERTREKTGPYFQRKLSEMASLPMVGEARGTGLIGALELLPREGKSGLDPNKPLGVKAMALARKEGVIVRGIRDLIAMAPPLTITTDEIDVIFDSLKRALGKLWD
jgi:putrescine aminotransferase